MADKITWLLGADSSQVRSEMAKAVQSVNAGTAGMTSSFGRVTAGNQRFLESNNRVTNQVAAFTRSLSGARSAADILSAGLDRLENSTNLSLGKGIFLAGSAVAVQQIQRLHEEYKKLNEEVKKLLQPGPSPEFRSLGNIKSKLDEVTKSLERLKKESQGGMFQNIMDAFGENLFTEDGEILPDSGKANRRRAKDIEGLHGKEDELKLAGVDKRRRQSDLNAAVTSGEITPFEAEAAKILIAFRELNPAVHEMTQTTIEMNQAFEALAKTQNDKNMERAGMTLKEMAGMTEGSVQASLGYNQDWTAMRPGQFQASQQAKRAIQLDELGEAQRLDFNPEGAHAGFNAAGEAKESLPNLKPSEKMSADFKGALQVVEENTAIIAENTAKQFVNR